LRNTPDNRLKNPISLFGFRVRYLDKEHFRSVVNEVFVDGCYWFHSEKPDPIIVDCGSNIGISILFFKMLYPRALVIGFEPDPNTFDVLCENVRVNRIENVELHNIALSDDDRDIDFIVSSEKQGSLLNGVFAERLRGVAIKVPAKRLSPFIPDRADLMKMDIEGSESIVMNELEASGTLGRIGHIHLEYHHHIIRAQDSMAEMLGLLERNGFGYQLQARQRHWPNPAVFQDVGLYAYRKGPDLTPAA
jgi:FkbM family methyltransferase